MCYVIDFKWRTRRGSWVRIPPPAPKNKRSTASRSFGFLSLAYSRTRGPSKSYRKIFLETTFCPGGISGFFFKTGSLSACPRFPDPEESPGNKRGNQCSKNRLPRIEIWADYQFVLADQPLKLLIRMSGTAPIWEAPPSPNHGQQRTLVTSNFKTWVN